MPLTIRRATNADVAEAVRIIKTVFDEYNFEWEADGYHADLYDLEAHYDRLGDAFFLAELDGVAVGTAAVEFFPRIPGEVGETVLYDGYVRVSGADCSLERLYVVPEARRGGVGAGLVLHVMEAGRAGGGTVMELWSDKRFGDAHRLYGRFDAKVVGERLCDDAERSPEWGLALPLMKKTPDA
ncbi:MAG: GNAT family N-acetyltransferase [Fimbriimonas sp.]